MNILEWALKLFNLVPYIATGINSVHNDLTPGGLVSKLTAAENLLPLAAAGASTLLSFSDNAKAGAIAQIASDALAATITDLHNAAQPK